VNRTSLSSRATWRTRSSSLDTPSPALGPERVSLAVFPSGRPLPSTTSAPACAGLFGGFAGTTSLSDFSRSCIKGLPPKRSPHGPTSADLPPREPSRTGHHHQLAGDHEISRFSRMELVVRARVLRPRRVHQRLAKASPAAWPSANAKSVGTLNSLGFRGSIAQPTRPLSTLRCALTGSPTHDSGPP